MTKHDLSSRHFQRKISEFCELRIAPIASRRVLENIRPYLASLIIYRKSPPLLNGHIDWTMISQACGIEAELTAELKKQLRPGLDAIIRWLGASALFFLAFLPQFVEVDRGHAAMQIAFLGLVYTAIGVLTDNS